MLQNAGTPEDVQTTWEEAVSKVAGNSRQNTIKVNNEKNLHRPRSDSKSSTRGSTTIGLQRLIAESAEQKETSRHQQNTRQRQNSLTSGGINRRRDEQNHEWRKRGNLSKIATAPGTSKYTTRNRMTITDVANALRQPRRTKRGVLNNEVDVPVDHIGQSGRGSAPAAGYVDPPRHPRPRTSPSLLNGRTSYRKVASTAGSNQLPHSVFDIGNRKNENARGRRRNNRARGRRRNQSSLMTLLRNPDDQLNDRQRSTAADGACKKKRLRVSFADVGWGEWIIAPDFFDAFYCDGFCNFPMSRVSQLYMASHHVVC